MAGVDPVQLARDINARIAADRMIAGAARALTRVVWLPEAFKPSQEGWDRVRVVLYKLHGAHRWLRQISIRD